MRRLVNQRPTRGGMLVLSMMPFMLLIVAYLTASSARLAANPGDKLLPSPATFAATIHRYALEEDERTGDILLWSDTAASLERLLIALGISAVMGVTFGVAIGVLPYLRATFAPFVAAVSLIPPLAILPILFIVAGLGELAKVLLIIIGVAPVIVRDLAFRIQELPSEQMIKAQTLGRLHLATDPSGGAAAALAAPDRRASPLARGRVALFDRIGGNRVHRRSRVSDLPGAALSRDGRDSALRRLDHAARLHHGRAAAAAALQGVPLGMSGRQQ